MPCSHPGRPISYPAPSQVPSLPAFPRIELTISPGWHIRAHFPRWAGQMWVTAHPSCSPGTPIQLHLPQQVRQTQIQQETQPNLCEMSFLCETSLWTENRGDASAYGQAARAAWSTRANKAKLAPSAAQVGQEQPSLREGCCSERPRWMLGFHSTSSHRSGKLIL